MTNFISIRRLCAAALLFLATGLANGATAQETQLSPYSSATRYDGYGRIVGTIAPDPDGAGPLGFAATRNFYDIAGLLVRTEYGELASWQPSTVAPPSWPAFTLLKTEHFAYDTMNRKVKSWVTGSDGQTVSVVQTNTDRAGRPACTAERMNPAGFASPPTNACTLGTQGNFGPDRITRNIYDAVGQLLKIQKGFGTPLQQDYVTYTYTPNGKQASVKDAGGNLATFAYDGHDRQTRWNFPSPTAIGSVNAADYEEYGYDANDNRTSLRKRDGSTISFQYDALNRNTAKIVPERVGLNATYTRDVYYGYDLRGLQTYARFDSATGEGVTTSYDGFGRATSSSLTMDGVTRTLSHAWDKNGNRTLLTYPDSNQVRFEYDGLDRLHVAYLGATGNAWFSYFDYNNRGLRSFQQGGGNSNFGYDAAGRLNSISHYNTNGSLDVSYTMTHNPAAQLTSRTISNTAYSWAGMVPVDRSYSVNGLNQYTNVAGRSFAYDGNGNLTSDGATNYIYDVENRLVSANGATLRYDPLGRLYEVGGAGLGVTRFLYDGDELVAEFDGINNMLRRYVHGAGVDDPVVWFEGAGFGGSNMRALRTDHQGSIVRIVNPDGSVTINSYDEFGTPPAPGVGKAHTGRFGYTGQIWIPEIGIWHYKGRAYSPTLGRFLQTDPVGYEDQVNLYAYVSNDPLSKVDPTGKFEDTAALQRAFALAQKAAEAQARKRLAVTLATEAPLIAATASLTCSSQYCGGKKVYATYTKTAENGRTYSGRTSIVVPRNVSDREAGVMAIAARDRGHHATAKGYGPAVLDKASEDRAAIRGREQQLIDFFGGAVSQGGTSGNMINGISDWNPMKSIYINAANAMFGRLPSNFGK